MNPARPPLSTCLRTLLLGLTLTVLAGGALGQVADPLPASTPGSAYTNLPDMGSGANAMISREDERQVGRMMMRNLRQENAVLDDPESTEYIQSIGSSIGAHAQDGETRFTFFVVRDQAVNAFAIPGGFIGVNVGMVLLTNNESELAGVLGHEIGHVVQRHIARAVQAQSRNSLTTMAAMLGAILIGAVSGSPDAMPGMISMVQGVALQQQINFTRMEEAEADRVGIGYIAAAGYDPNAVATLWTQMSLNQGPASYYDIPDMLKTHPVNSLRIAEGRSRAAQFPRKPPRIDPPSYALIRERLRVIATDRTADQRPYYAAMKANGTDTLATRYGAALADMAAGDAAQAVKSLRELVAANTGVTILHTALGQAQIAAGDQDGALATFARANALYPRNIPITVRYAEALLGASKAAQAHQLLLDVFNNVTPTPEQIRLTALAASSAGDTGDAYYYMSEYHIASGDLMLATQQLDLALAAPALTDVQRKRFRARLDEIRGFLRDQRKPR
ncbi:MAG: M48 family metalloprotease, partial [Pseudomonadota bacterium]